MSGKSKKMMIQFSPRNQHGTTKSAMHISSVESRAFGNISRILQQQTTREQFNYRSFIVSVKLKPQHIVKTWCKLPTKQYFCHYFALPNWKDSRVIFGSLQGGLIQECPGCSCCWDSRAEKKKGINKITSINKDNTRA